MISKPKHAGSKEKATVPAIIQIELLENSEVSRWRQDTLKETKEQH